MAEAGRSRGISFYVDSSSLWRGRGDVNVWANRQGNLLEAYVKAEAPVNWRPKKSHQAGPLEGQPGYLKRMIKGYPTEHPFGPFSDYVTTEVRSRARYTLFVHNGTGVVTAGGKLMTLPWARPIAFEGRGGKGSSPWVVRKITGGTRKPDMLGTTLRPFVRGQTANPFMARGLSILGNQRGWRPGRVPAGLP